MEQTSSTAYPNALVVDYLRKARRANPEVMMKAETYLSTGYQMILTFQRQCGGFSWWPNEGDPAVLWVTAYGVQELYDSSRVIEVDPNVLKRANDWMASQQGADGSWSIPGHTHGVSIEHMKNPAMALTGYVAWTMAMTGYKGGALTKALDYLKAKVDGETNAYALALAACAMAAAEPDGKATREILKQIDDLKKVDGEYVSWGGDGQSFSYASGDSLAVETTSLVALAMLDAGGHTGTVNKALAYLVKARGSHGAWGSTQATILALKALLRAMGGERQTDAAKVRVTLDGETSTVVIDPDQSDVMQLVDFGKVAKGRHSLKIELEGKTSMLYQVVARHHMPWHLVQTTEEEGPIHVAVKYDRTQLKTGDTLKATATLRYTGAATTYMVIVDLGLPPGFEVDATAFESMVEKGAIAKYAATSRNVLLYFGGMEKDKEVTFSYDLRAKYPIKAKTPKTTAYEYYTPENRDVAKPVEIEVRD